MSTFNYERIVELADFMERKRRKEEEGPRFVGMSRQMLVDRVKFLELERRDSFRPCENCEEYTRILDLDDWDQCFRDECLADRADGDAEDRRYERRCNAGDNV